MYLIDLTVATRSSGMLSFIACLLFLLGLGFIICQSNSAV